MHLMVHVKSKVCAIACGDGSQPVKWIANVATARYDEAQGRSLGQPSGVRLEDGTRLSLTQTLADAGLKNQQHLWIVFQKLRAGGAAPKATGAADVDDDDS